MIQQFLLHRTVLGDGEDWPIVWSFNVQADRNDLDFVLGDAEAGDGFEDPAEEKVCHAAYADAVFEGDIGGGATPVAVVGAV